MAGETSSPNMSLPIPGVGVTSGSQYATDVNNALTIIDQHNHVSGSGVPIPPAGLNINSDLTFGSNNAIALRSARFTSQNSPLALAADLDCVYVSGVDLYYNDGNGNQIRITQSGAVSGASGTITGLPSGTASASYNSGSGTFIFQSATNTPANIDVGAVILRNNTASSKGLTLSPPNAMGADLALVLPSPPAAQSFVTLDSGGNFGAPIAYAGGITSANIADHTVTGVKIADATISDVNLVTNIELPGTNVTAGTLKVVTSSYSDISCLMIAAGRVDISGNLINGGGFTSARVSIGLYSITYTRAFSSTPAVNVTLELSTNTFIPRVVGSTSTGCVVEVGLGAGATDSPFSIMAIGPR